MRRTCYGSRAEINHDDRHVITAESHIVGRGAEDLVGRRDKIQERTVDVNHCNVGTTVEDNAEHEDTDCNVSVIVVQMNDFNDGDFNKSVAENATCVNDDTCSGDHEDTDPPIMCCQFP